MTDKGLAGHFYRKSTYILLQLTIWYCYTTATIYSFFVKRRSNDEVKKIANVWYWPMNFNADELRMSYWRKYFEKDGIQMDDFWILHQKEFVEKWERGTWPTKYMFYRRQLLRRWKQFFQMKNYDVVWIDRGFFPYYTLQTRAVFERGLRRMGIKVVIDCTDGTDYESNAELVLDTMAQADSLTVGYKKLYEFYEDKVPKITRLNWTVPVDGYVVKENWNWDGRKPILGWMGSPTNFNYLKDIEGELQKLANEIPFDMIIICRLEKTLDLEGVNISHHFYGDDYKELISKFDIGLAPFTEKNFGTEGKIGMKHQEFMITQTPQVCSSVGISEHSKQNEHCMIADEIEDWFPMLKDIMTDEEKRKRIATNSRKLFDEHYHYDKWYPALKDALTNFSHLD